MDAEYVLLMSVFPYTCIGQHFSQLKLRCPRNSHRHNHVQLYHKHLWLARSPIHTVGSPRRRREECASTPRWRREVPERSEGQTLARSASDFTHSITVRDAKPKKKPRPPHGGRGYALYAFVVALSRATSPAHCLCWFVHTPPQRGVRTRVISPHRNW